MSTLSVIASPIGNLGDLSPRAVEALREARHVAAEDTRRSRQLLSHLGISGKPLICLDAHASERAVEGVVQLLLQGEQVALLTDAGTPSVSDPGAALVRRCHEQGLKVVPIPGPSAVTAAIAASGLVEGPFLFVGFLPRKGSKRTTWLDKIRASEEPVVLFEAPQRVAKTISDLSVGQEERPLCVARELTKRFEEIAVRSLGVWRDDEREWRGEVTLVLGRGANATREAELDDDALERLIGEELARGAAARDIAGQHHARAGISKRTLYQRVLEIKSKQNQ